MASSRVYVRTRVIALWSSAAAPTSAAVSVPAPRSAPSPEPSTQCAAVLSASSSAESAERRPWVAAFTAAAQGGASRSWTQKVAASSGNESTARAVRTSVNTYGVCVKLRAPRVTATTRSRAPPRSSTTPPGCAPVSPSLRASASSIAIAPASASSARSPDTIPHGARPREASSTPTSWTVTSEPSARRTCA
ncbi:MAG: hypothetical protein KF850_16040 [Labilithrix sp.]|nr:hypothetical protein [Labilithrix sp.]